MPRKIQNIEYRGTSAAIIPEIHEGIISKVIESLRDQGIDLNKLSKMEEIWRKRLAKIQYIKPEPSSSASSDDNNPRVIVKEIDGYRIFRFAVSDRQLTRQEVEQKLREAQMILKSKGIKEFSGKGVSDVFQTDGAISDDDDKNGDEEYAEYLNDPNYVNNHDVNNLEKVEESINFNVTKIKKDEVDVKEECFQRGCSGIDDVDNKDFKCVAELNKNKYEYGGDIDNFDCSDEEDIVITDENKNMDELPVKDENIDINLDASLEELNSDDDVEGLDIFSWDDCENTIYCTSTKIKKTKKTHNFTIDVKDGIMCINGKEHAFKSLYCKQMWVGSRYFVDRRPPWLQY